MSTHNICFRQEVRKLLCGYPLLSVAMAYVGMYVQFHDTVHIYPTK